MPHVKPWKSSKARRLECDIIAYMPLLALKGQNQSNPWSRETRPWGKAAKNGGPDRAELYCNSISHRLLAIKLAFIDSVFFFTNNG